MNISVKPCISELAPYSPPWTGLDRQNYLRLDLNENTSPHPSHVTKALKKLLKQKNLQMYPDYGWFLKKLSQYTDVSEAQTILTNGSDQGIEIILRAFLNPGDGILFARPEFPIFAQVASVIGATIQGVAYEKDLSFPFERFIQAVNKKTKLIVLINPNNPTGTSVSLEQIEKILQKFPHLPVIVDEAYYEFTNITAIHLLDRYPNLIITRTFSKAFAMAGLRLGYILAHPDLIAEFYKIRCPFDVNTCALYAASAQIDENTHWKTYVNEVISLSKPIIEEYFTKKGVPFIPGSANFMLVKPSNRDFAVNHLKKHRILARPMFAPMIDDMFRLSIGTINQMKTFIDVFDRFLKENPS
ncbi:pyridoxal phosphate-dependent aminotransferase [Magnetococcales bacterium HHB-1]